MQPFSSLHAVPSGAVGFEQTPVAGSQTPTPWHASLAAHATAAPEHRPPWHASPVVQASPSLHAVPSGLTETEHCPVDGLQTPASWQASAAAHVTGFEPVHVPPWHVSACVHAFPSLHAVPLGAAGLLQTPVAWSHEPAT